MKVFSIQPHYYECSKPKPAKSQVAFNGGKAVYAGSFDPITNGHLDLIKEASKLFDELFVLIAKNPKKTPFLPTSTRLNLISESVKDIKNVEVDAFDGMTVDFAKLKGANYLLRGMRKTTTDFLDEVNVAQTNEILAPDIRTVLLFSNSVNNATSSSKVREALARGEDVSTLVPKPVFEYLTKLRGEI